MITIKENQGKSSVKIPPYYYPFKDIFSILYPISREVKDKILRKNKNIIPLNSASLHTLPGINTYYKHCYEYGAIYE